MSDIVERLQGRARHDGWSTEDVLSGEAADAILRLRAENEKLRAALDPFARMSRWLTDSDTDPDDLTPLWDANDLPTLGDLRAAAAALKETGDD